MSLKFFTIRSPDEGASSGAGGAAGATGAVGAGTPAPVDWTAGFSEELKGYVGSKGFKTPDAVVDAYRNMEKFQGVPQERLAKLPERFYDDSGKLTPEGRVIRERLGAGKAAKDYELPTPKEGGDAALMEHFKNVFHETGISTQDAKRVVESWNEYMGKQMGTAKEAAAAKFKADQEALAKEWGGAHEQNTRIAQEAARTLGFKKEQVDAIASTLGHAETMKLLHRLGKQTGEASFHSGQRQDGILEPATAKERIRALMEDKAFGARLQKGDVDARSLFENLHKQAYPGEMRL